MIDWISLSTPDIPLAMNCYRKLMDEGGEGTYYRRHFGTAVVSFTGRFWARVEENHGLARVHGFRLQGFDVTRADFAWDVPGARMGIAKIELKGAITTILSPTGTTLYSGSRESVRFLRIYDKRAEIKARTGVDVNEDLTRVELETKRDVARTYLKLYETGEGAKILDDVKERYGLSFLDGNPGSRITVANPDAGNPLDFVLRFYKVIGKALLADPKLFVRALELEGQVTCAIVEPLGTT